MTENKDYIIKEIRKEDDSIQFFLFGLASHVDDMLLVTNFIKESLKPIQFDYKYDWFDTYEKGYL